MIHRFNKFKSGVEDLFRLLRSISQLTSNNRNGTNVKRVRVVD